MEWISRRTAVPVLHDVHVGHKFVPSSLATGPVLVAVVLRVIRLRIFAIAKVLIAANGRTSTFRHYGAATACAMALTPVARRNHVVLLAGGQNVGIGGGAGSEGHAVESVAAKTGGYKAVIRG